VQHEGFLAEGPGRATQRDALPDVYACRIECADDMFDPEMYEAAHRMCEESGDGSEYAPGIMFPVDFMKDLCPHDVALILRTVVSMLTGHAWFGYIPCGFSHIDRHVGLILKDHACVSTDSLMAYRMSGDRSYSDPFSATARLRAMFERATAKADDRKRARNAPVSGEVNSLDALVSDDVVDDFATMWSQYAPGGPDRVYSPDPCPFPLQHRFYLDLVNATGEIDVEYYLRYIGHACAVALKGVHYHTLTDNRLVIARDILCVWIHACLGFFSEQDSELVNRVVQFDNLCVPPVNGEEAWMLDWLDKTLARVIHALYISPIEQKGRTISDEIIADSDLLGALCDRFKSIRPFVTLTDACDSIAYYMAALWFLRLFPVSTPAKEGPCNLSRVYQNISDRHVYTQIITPDVLRAVAAAARECILSRPWVPPTPVNFPHIRPMIMDAEDAGQSARRIVRTMVEYSPCVLAAAPDPLDLALIVQGGNFGISMVSPSVAPQSKSLRLDAYTALVEAACPVPGVHTVVQLPSQFCVFNRTSTQHDYLPFMPAWEGGGPSAPRVYTAIMNLSEVPMQFTYTDVGRAVEGGRKRGKNVPRPDIVVPPGHMVIYERQPACRVDGREVSWQCRLSKVRELSDHGIPYMQASIAVYEVAKITPDDRARIGKTARMVAIGGVVENMIYWGRQGYERNKHTRRAPYPLIYTQITNAFKPKMRESFMENFGFMQRPQIRRLFGQTVMLVRNRETRDYRLFTPDGAVAYDETVGYDRRYQRMAYDDLLVHVSSVTKQKANASSGATLALIETVSGRKRGAAAGGPSQKKQKEDDENDDPATSAANVGEEETGLAYIYASNPPPLRNLVGLLCSDREHYVVTRGAPMWELRMFGIAI
jgi:hypothetical protein